MPVPRGYTVDAPKLPQGYALDSPGSSGPAGLPAGVDLPGFPAASFPKMDKVTSFAPSTIGQNIRDNSQLQPVHGKIAPFINNIGATVGGNITGALAHPINTLAGLFTFGKNDPMVQRLEQAKQEWRTDPGLAISHGLGDVATGVLTDGAMRAGVPALRSLASKAVRAPFIPGIDEPIIGTSITPRQRYAAAKSVGVQLDLADATNAPVPKMLKAVNQDSLFGGGTYEKAKAKNISALSDATDANLNEMSPLDIETGGKRLQDLLKENQASLKAESQSGYQQIGDQFGEMPVSDPKTLSTIADDIKAQQAQHLKEFPSLKPAQIGGVIEDASQYGKMKVAPSGLVDEHGVSISSSIQPTPPTVANVLKARSGILDMYANNPELVKSASDAQLQRLAGGAHDVVMNSIPPEAQSTLRDAQSTWKELKSTYDDPSSPLYDAIRTSSPSAKVSRLGPPTPESIRGIMGRIGDEGTGILQRGETERALGTTAAGGYNFGTFPKKLERIPEPYANELFGGKLGKLRDISSTAQALSKDLNPSGTAKQGQKFAEAAALIPTGGLPALQYPLARFINSPTITDFMMRPSSAAKARLRLNAPIPFPLRPLLQANGTRGD